MASLMASARMSIAVFAQLQHGGTIEATMVGDSTGLNRSVSDAIGLRVDEGIPQSESEIPASLESA